MWDPVQLKDCDALTSEVDYIVSVKDNSVQNGLNPRLEVAPVWLDLTLPVSLTKWSVVDAWSLWVLLTSHELCRNFNTFWCLNILASDQYKRCTACWNLHFETVEWIWLDKGAACVGATLSIILRRSEGDRWIHTETNKQNTPLTLCLQERPWERCKPWAAFSTYLFLLIVNTLIYTFE